jgi:hypothetical protein
MNYEPAPTPLDDKALREFLSRELRRISGALRDDSQTVAYQTGSVVGSLSAGVSANWKVAGNLLLLSTSSTITLTGIADTTPNRVRTFINIGTGVVVFKSQGTESSASYRFALPADWQLSTNATATLWYDARAFRHRGLSRT